MEAWLRAYYWERKLRNWNFEGKIQKLEFWPYAGSLQKAINEGRDLLVIVQAFDFQPFLFSLQKGDLFVTKTTT